MRAFVTGAFGWLGSHLVKALDKCEVLVMLRRDVRPLDDVGAKQRIVRGTLEDIGLLERALGEYEIDVVVHLAAQTDVRIAHAEPLSTWESNVRGTYNLMEACRRQKVRRVIVASTDKAYGWTPPPYKEADALRASAMYETSKTCSDLIAQSYMGTYDMSVAITRCGNFYG